MELYENLVEKIALVLLIGFLVNVFFINTSLVNAQTTISVSSCTDISTPGFYNITQDIRNLQNMPCVNIHDTNNVKINCNNHFISSPDQNQAVFVKNVTGFSINHCVLTTSIILPTDRIEEVFRVQDSSNGTITSNTLGGNYISMANSSQMTLSNNTFNAQVLVYRSTNNIIKNNTFVNINNSAGGANLTLQEGKVNAVLNNRINGASDGVFRGVGKSTGSDDSIVIKDETNDIISNNIIKNNWDCGIENEGFLFDSKITTNTISNIGICGIGGWYFSSVKGDTFTGNVVDKTPYIFYFYRAYGLKPGDPEVFFKDNVFSNNILTNRKNSAQASNGETSWIAIDSSAVPNTGERAIKPSDVIVGNNIFKNNNFGSNLKAPHLDPKTMIVDGGGNICKTPTSSGYPLKCKSGTKSVAVKKPIKS